MKTHYQKHLMLVLFLAIAISGCTGLRTVTEIEESEEDRRRAMELAELKAEEEARMLAYDEEGIPEDYLEKKLLDDERRWLLEQGSVNAQLNKLAAETGMLFVVYFDYDSHIITRENIKTVKDNARWIKSNPKSKIRITGHADERGSNEYNLALGERRAVSVKKYLRDLGISGGRLDTISFGEEQPAVSSHDEAAWQKNRRVEFIIK